jgi:hypothetical protein
MSVTKVSFHVVRVFASPSWVLHLLSCDDLSGTEGVCFFWTEGVCF